MTFEGALGFIPFKNIFIFSTSQNFYAITHIIHFNVFLYIIRTTPVYDFLAINIISEFDISYYGGMGSSCSYTHIHYFCINDLRFSIL